MEVVSSKITFFFKEFTDKACPCTVLKEFLYLIADNSQQ
jgi:hypothetical protein